MSVDGRYKFSFSKVPGKVMENEVTIIADGKGGFTGFLHNISGDHPISGTIDENNVFAFAFAGGHRHPEQDGHPPAGGPPAGDVSVGGPAGRKPPAGGPGEPLVMNFSGTIHEDGTLDGSLTVMDDVTPIKGSKIS